MPVPPPVTITVLPFADSSRRVGDMDWYVFECQFFVGDGKGAAMVTVRDTSSSKSCMNGIV
jgi:hypothetical protein